MNNKSEMITPLPQRVQQASADLRWAGRIGFWVQLVLGVISLVLVLVSSSSFVGGDNAANTQGNEFGVFCAICGLIALVVGIYFSFRYMNIAQSLQDASRAEQRPNRADTIKVVRIGLLINLAGMAITIIGAQAIVGIVLVKSLATPAGGGFTNLDPSKLVNSIDLFVIQANTNTITAHFAGIVSSLLLLNRITR